MSGTEGLKMRLGVIGAGHIGSAILHAVLDSGLYPPEDIWVCDADPAKLEPFAGNGCHTGSDNREVLRESELIVLAVRPADMPDLLQEIAPVVREAAQPAVRRHCLLSVAAGVTIETIRGFLPPGTPVMRAMPNTPITVRRGATAVAIPHDVPAHFARAARDIFDGSGVAELLDETLLAAATGLNGSGPGYFFRIASVMIDCAREQGVPPDAAANLVAETMAGAAEMLKTSRETPRALAQNVAVPGGTTEAAFRVMDRLGFDSTLRAAMLDCAARAEELGR